MDQELAQRIERDVRMLIGDLQIQVIVLKHQVEMQKTSAPQPDNEREIRPNGGERPNVQP